MAKQNQSWGLPMRVLLLLTLFSFVLSCAEKSLQVVKEQEKRDPLEPLREELRRDFEEFLRKAREIQREGLR